MEIGQNKNVFIFFVKDYTVLEVISPGEEEEEEEEEVFIQP